MRRRRRWLTIAILPWLALLAGSVAASGLRSGDLLIEVDGRPLPDQGALERVLAASAPGQALGFAVLRAGTLREIPVVAQARRNARVASPAPDPAPAPPLPLWFGRRTAGLGAVVSALTEELRLHYGAPRDHGVLVLRVGSGGAHALRAGLRGLG